MIVRRGVRGFYRPCMDTLVLAITHQTLSASEELECLARQRVAIGTAIKGKLASALTGRERIDVDLLARLGAEGGLAIVTYGKDNPRRLGRFAAGSQVVLLGALRSLTMKEMKELPASLCGINTMGGTIREVTGAEREAVLTEATRLRWGAPTG